MKDKSLVVARTKDMKLREKKFRIFLDNMKGLKVKSQIDLFKERFGLGRKSYFRYKKCILNNKPLNHFDTSYRRIITKRSTCYFCEKDFGLIVHHKDKNPKNNKTRNLIILCNKCHRKIHSLMILNPKFLYVVNVLKKEIKRSKNAI